MAPYRPDISYRLHVRWVHPKHGQQLKSQAANPRSSAERPSPCRLPGSHGRLCSGHRAEGAAAGAFGGQSGLGCLSLVSLSWVEGQLRLFSGVKGGREEEGAAWSEGPSFLQRRGPWLTWGLLYMFNCCDQPSCTLRALCSSALSARSKELHIGLA